MSGPGPGALSIFGENYEPADPPATDVCPGCGGLARRSILCDRCRARGIEAPRLDLAGPAPGHTTPSAVALAAHRDEHPDAVVWSPATGWADTCNACDAAPADPDDPAGYCPDCGPGAYCEPETPVADTPPAELAAAARLILAYLADQRHHRTPDAALAEYQRCARNAYDAGRTPDGYATESYRAASAEASRWLGRHDVLDDLALLARIDTA